MATKRQILESLNHKDLLAIAESFELSIENRRRKGNVVDAVVVSRSAKLPHVLKEFSLAQLKETCRKLKIEVSGRTKVDFIEGLLGKKSVKAITTKSAKPVKPVEAKTSNSKPTVKQKAKPPAKAKTTVAKTTKEKTETKETKAPVKAKAAPKKAKPLIEKAKPLIEKAKPLIEKAKPLIKKAKPLIKKAKPLIKKAKKEAAEPVKAKPEPAEPQKESHPAAPDYSRMARPAAPVVPTNTQCIACKSEIATNSCQANDCETPMLASENRKICAGCWFDRSGGSFDFFLTEYKKDTTCPNCETQWANFDD